MTTSITLAQRLGEFVEPNDGADILRIIAVGSLKVVNQHIMRKYQLGYAQPHEWSRPLPTVKANEVMCILTKRIVGGDR